VKDYPYWWDTVPAHAFDTPSPTHFPARVDVAIVGAGYTGLAAARQLARAGASVLVLERERVGWGASSRNGGQVLTGLKIDVMTLVAKYGEARARTMFDAALRSIERVEAIVAEERIDCDYVRCGHVQAAWKPSHFTAFRDEQAFLARVFGHHVDLVPRAEQRREVGSDAYHGLLIDERSSSLNPARYVLGLAAAATRAGACVAAGVAVEHIARANSGWTLSTSTGDVVARDVFVATNGYTDRAAPALQRRFVPIGSYIIATAPLSDTDAATVLPRGRVAFDSKHFLYYFRVTPDRRLLFGGRAEFSRPDPQSTARAATILRRGLAAIFPQLAEAVVEYAWCGTVAFTRDELPHAGRLDGQYFAGGYCGHGIAMATHLGELIARRIAGEPIDHPLFDDRFAPIPLYSGRPWFLPMAGAYYKVKDWLQ
jgi:glycine/D-amino acid oxidase-like deaminating enzyme